MGIFFCFAFITVRLDTGDQWLYSLLCLLSNTFQIYYKRIKEMLESLTSNMFFLIGLYSFNFNPRIICCILKARNLSISCWPPIKIQVHTGSRVRGLKLQRNYKARSRGGVFLKLVWKVQLSFWSQEDTRKKRRGNKWEFISVLLFLGPSTEPCIKKDHHQ